MKFKFVFNFDNKIMLKHKLKFKKHSATKSDSA